MHPSRINQSREGAQFWNAAVPHTGHADSDSFHILYNISVMRYNFPCVETRATLIGRGHRHRGHDGRPCVSSRVLMKGAGGGATDE